MIKAWVESDKEGFGGGAYVFAALPPIGSDLLVRDGKGGKYRLRVANMELYGIREDDWPATEQIGGHPDVIIYCRG